MARDLRKFEFSDPELEDDEGVELSLGLSIGGSCRKPAMAASVSQRSESAVRSGVSDPEKDPVPDFVGGSSSRLSLFPINGGDLHDPKRRREMHALRRQEARKKRDEKQQKKGIYRGRSSVVVPGFGCPARTCSFDDRMLLDAQEFQSRARDREARENEACWAEQWGGRHRKSGESKAQNPKPNPNPTPFGAPTFPLMPMQFPYPPVHYMPIPNGFGFPCMMPCWAPTISNVADGLNDPARNVFQPVPCRSLPIPSPPSNTNGNPTGSCDSETNGEKDVGVKRAPSTTGSQGSSSSGVSDYHSGYVQGGSSSSSSDTRSHSNHTATEKPQPQVSPPQSSHNISDRGTESSSQVNDGVDNNKLVSVATHSSPKANSNEGVDNNKLVSVAVHSSPKANSNPAEEIKGGISVNKPISASENEKPQTPPSLPQMPCVITTGNGPNGKTVSGFLYRYTKTEVSIVCVCHGTSFTPAEFVKHAGGTDIAHPLRHIVVVPS